MNWFDSILALVIVAVLALAIAGFYESRDAFVKACSANGGATVFDGRQLQCFTKKANP
jgi:hypothetical protein